MKRDIKFYSEREKGIVIEEKSCINFPIDGKLKDKRAQSPIKVGRVYFMGLLGNILGIARIQPTKIDKVFDVYVQIGEKEWEVHTKVEGVITLNNKNISFVVEPDEEFYSDINDVLPPSNIEDREILIADLHTFILEGKYPQKQRSLLEKVFHDDEYASKLLSYRNTFNSLVVQNERIKFTEEVIINQESKNYIEIEEKLISKYPRLKKGLKIFNKEDLRSVKVELEIEDIEDLIEIRTKLKKQKVEIEDKRIDFLPPGPFYQLILGVLWEVEITSLYSVVMLEEDKMTLYTCIEYKEEDNYYAWYSMDSLSELPPLPKEYIYLFFDMSSKNPYITKEKSLKYKELTPLNYPFKYFL